MFYAVYEITQYAYCVAINPRFEISKRRIYILRGLHNAWVYLRSMYTATKFSAGKKKWHFFQTADSPTQYANSLGSLSAWNIYNCILNSHVCLLLYLVLSKKKSEYYK